MGERQGTEGAREGRDGGARRDPRFHVVLRPLPKTFHVKSPLGAVYVPDGSCARWVMLGRKGQSMTVSKQKRNFKNLDSLVNRSGNVEDFDLKEHYRDIQ